MEENRSFSLTSLLIKAIIVIIFVLFTVWLLSLSTNGLSNSLDVLTDNIFSQNIEKMKEVGKDYFTTERLPQKIGDVKTITLEEMYEKKLILEITDKDGHACSAKNSYVSIEKYDNEYQMKVYLECGKEKDYVIVTMGCYDYCDSDICEIKKEEKQIEYEYKKTTGGRWTDYGNWSEWSKVPVTKTDYREIETKIENEEYSYEKTEVEIIYTEFEASCPDGYKMNEEKTKCVTHSQTIVTADPVCPTKSGYTLTGQDGFNCYYSKTTTSTITDSATCPTGYTKSGNTCTKTTTTTITKDATCPTGYTKSGNNCIKSNVTTKDPICPTLDGYTFTNRSGFTCTYKSNTYTDLTYIRTETGEEVPANTKTYLYKEVGDPQYVESCDDQCKFVWIHTWKVYKKEYGTKTNSATCPTGYTQSGSTCAKTTTDTKTPSCPVVSGYTNTGRDGFTCTYSKQVTETKNPTCPTKSGYTNTGRDGFTCTYSKQVTSNITDNATCPTDYKQNGNTCEKAIIKVKEKDIQLSCPTGYMVSDDDKCYKAISKTVTVTETREVTYYRYRVREYIGGTTDYKWSTSKNDQKLLNAGYKLTGRTR